MRLMLAEALLENGGPSPVQSIGSSAGPLATTPPTP